MRDLGRIDTEYETEAMVAPDTFDLLVARVRRLVDTGRRMTIARRYATWAVPTPEVVAGLVLDTDARGGGVWTAVDERSVYCGVTLRGGDRYDGFGFGADIHEYSGYRTEVEAWNRYHTHEAEHADFFRRRRDMTHVAIVGGVDGWRPSRRDKIVIHAWNSDGVCDQRVITFDQGD